MIRCRSLICLLALLAAPACRPEATGDESVDPEHILEDRESVPEEVTAHLDSGSVAFRNDELEEALTHYERAAELAPDYGAAWFGVYMVERARGNVDAANEALGRAQDAMPGATLLDPEVGDTTR